MNSQEKFDYWLERAQYDLETAKAMFASGRWLYVAFMCQQSIEKLAKGLYSIYINDNTPRIHDLNQIIIVFEACLSTPLNEEQKVFLDHLSTFYIDSRYPDFKQSIAKLSNSHEAKIILTKTMEIFSCLMISQK